MTEPPTGPTRSDSPEFSTQPAGVGDRLASWSRVVLDRTRAGAAGVRALAEEGARRGRSAAGEARERQEAFRLRRERARCCRDIGSLVAARPAGLAASTLKQESPGASTLLERVAAIDARLADLDAGSVAGDGNA